MPARVLAVEFYLPSHFRDLAYGKEFRTNERRSDRLIGYNFPSRVACGRESLVCVGEKVLSLGGASPAHPSS